MRIKFYLTSSGRSPVEEFLKELNVDVREDFQSLYDDLESYKLLEMPHSKNLSSIHKGLYELRLKDRHGIYRLFYYIKKYEEIYFIHAYRKKTQTIPLKEIRLILKRIKEV